jgi:hypothetical protein
MSVTITHAKVSVNTAAPADSTLVAGTDWNNNHTINPSSERAPAVNATVAILASDVEVAIDTSGGAVTVNLPSAAAWAAANPLGLPLSIQDKNGHAATNNITPSLNGADTFRGGVTPVVTANYGSLVLRPAGNPVTGWKVVSLN